MSKERALLVRAFTVIDSRDFPVLCKEIEELLAQPELSTDSLQLDKQEPVVWIDPENYKQAIAKPDGALRYITRTPNDGDIPLYTSPPKREPLSYRHTANMFHANKKATNAVCYWEGVYDAEKAHGIGGKE